MHNETRKKKRISDALFAELWDSHANDIIEEISLEDKDLGKVDAQINLQLFSTNKNHLCRTSGVFIEDFVVDVDLEKECIYVNRSIPSESKIVSCILAAFCAHKHLTSWPNIPIDLSRNSIDEYESAVLVFRRNLEKEMTEYFSEIFNKTNFEKKEHSYPITFKSTKGMFFGRNKEMKPKFDYNPKSVLLV
ncbi:MAG: hypothetical protein Mars2KO_44230 [Maribacter sp.]